MPGPATQDLPFLSERGEVDIPGLNPARIFHLDPSFFHLDPTSGNWH